MTGQSDFALALLDAARPAPQGLVTADGRPAGKRFDVYRNNVSVSLTEALATGFPVVRKLVGDAFFAAMAGVFFRAHPPDTPVLLRYGEAMPSFLETFTPAASLPYLADVARLELSLRRAYHAADSAPFNADTLSQIPPEQLVSARLKFAAAVDLLSSRWPIHGIWRANTEADAPNPPAEAQTVLITRPGYDPVASPLAAGDAACVAALLAGSDLGSASDAGSRAEPSFDLSQILGFLLAQQAITAVQERPEP